MVIPTFERPDACAAAVESALGQTLAPVEVLVCDDGSRDDTPERFSAWERGDARVRYLGLPHAGSPGPSRNAGVRAARGDWVAFLDDDDRWLPEKLERQGPHLRPDRVVATNARLTSGGIYFPDLREPRRHARSDVLRVNPVVVSSAVAPREAVLAAGGFPEPRWARGVADYGLWLALADRGADFLVLPDVLVEYEDDPAGRMSSKRAVQETAVARLAWGRALRAPADRGVRRAAANHAAAAGRVWWEDRVSRRRAPSG